MCSSDLEPVLQGVISAIYSALRRNILGKGPTGVESKVMGTNYLSRQIVIEYARWLRNRGRPVADSLDLLTFFSDHLQGPTGDDRTDMLGKLVVEIAGDADGLSESDLGRLFEVLDSA